MPITKAIEQIEEEAGKQFNPEAVEVFVDVASEMRQELHRRT
jgi:response regulator RpfG family c-di-GMP phosphodiesterase